MKYRKLFSGMLLIFSMMVLAVPSIRAQSDLTIDQRIAIVERKIEGGAIRGDLTRDEYSRLKPRLAVVKYRRAKMEKDGVTEKAYKDLEHYLLGLEMDTDRLINKFRGR